MVGRLIDEIDIPPRWDQIYLSADRPASCRQRFYPTVGGAIGITSGKTGLPEYRQQREAGNVTI